MTCNPTHADLVAAGARWLRSSHKLPGLGRHHVKCVCVITEMSTACGETPDVIGWTGDGLATVLEAKLYRADFRRDMTKHFRRYAEYGMGNSRYFIVPRGLISVGELPCGWGLIEVIDTGCARVVVASNLFEPSNKRNEVRTLLSLLRRMKVDPGPHVAISAYRIETSSCPVATVGIAASEHWPEGGSPYQTQEGVTWEP